MSVARIAAMAFVFSSAALAAQSVPSNALKIKVTDATGAAVPRALIQARTSESKVTSKAETDARGEAVLYLTPDISTVSARAVGFDVWQYKMDVRKDVGKPLVAVLRIESYYGPTLVNADPELEIERQSLVASIPLEPLESVVDLPSHKLRDPGRRRRWF